MTLAINGMILQENYFKNPIINFSDQENNVVKDGSIILIQVRKEGNGKRNKIKSSLNTFLITVEDGVI